MKLLDFYVQFFENTAATIIGLGSGEPNGRGSSKVQGEIAEVFFDPYIRYSPHRSLNIEQ